MFELVAENKLNEENTSKKYIYASTDTGNLGNIEKQKNYCKKYIYIRRNSSEWEKFYKRRMLF